MAKILIQKIIQKIYKKLFYAGDLEISNTNKILKLNIAIYIKELNNKFYY